MARIEEFDPLELGDRLRKARQSAGLSQAEACEIAGVSRTTLVHTEQGKRLPKIQELVKLAPKYGTTVSRLLRRASVHIELTPQFRRTGSTVENDSAGLDAVRLLQQLAAAYTELEREVFPAARPTYVPPLKIQSRWIYEQAEDAALGLRSSLGVGMGPIPDIVELMEAELRFRVFIRSMDSRISGVFAFQQEVGPCVLLNAKHPRHRQDQSAAHELGHFIGDRKADVIVGTHDPTSTSERFATHFGLAFLMPPPAIRSRFASVVEEGHGFSARQLIHLALQFHVSTEAMARWLERLSLIPEGTYNALRARGLSGQHVREVLGHDTPRRRRITTRLALLVAEAYDRGIRTESQLADMMDLDRVRLRELLCALDAGSEIGRHSAS